MYYKFTPILKNTIWGGTKIAPFKNIQTQLRKVGESWEISGVPGNETIVSGGPDAGRNLNDLVAEQKEALVGKANYDRFGNEFPLLIKFIDARDDLSIQVHPTDEIAHRQGRERGKTEMWYLMPSEPEATLLCGLKKHITPDEYKRMVSEKTKSMLSLATPSTRATASSCPQAASMPLAPVASLQRSSRQAM